MAEPLLTQDELKKIATSPKQVTVGRESVSNRDADEVITLAEYAEAKQRKTAPLRKFLYRAPGTRD